MIGLLAGGGVAILALVIGHFEGYLMGSKVRNLSALVIKPEPVDHRNETRDCICKHMIVAHKVNDKGMRKACTVATKWDDKAKTFGAVCACEGYVPKPVEVRKGDLEI